MKFSQHLSAHLTPEWRSQYINYDSMKKTLYEILEDAPVAGFSEYSYEKQNGVDPREEYFRLKDEEFLGVTCANELEKLNLFFEQKMAEAKRRFTELNHNLEKYGFTDLNTHLNDSHKLSQSMHIRVPLEGIKREKVLTQLRFAFSEYYLSLILIQNYQELNFTGFRKILKKHDKLWNTTRGMEWRSRHVLNAPFYIDQSVDELITITENIYIDRLMNGDRSRAMKRLRVLPISEQQSPWTTFRLGLCIGSFAVTVLVLACTYAFKPMRGEPKWVAVRLFRGFLVLFLNAFLVGWNLYGWQSAGVNHVLIFEIDPRDHLTYQRIMEIPAGFLLLWSFCAIGYMYHDILGIPKLSMPLLLMFICLVWLFNPFNFAHKSSRMWFLRKLYICATPLCHNVLFADFWLADQMNSLVTFFLDMQYFFCFYATEVDWFAWASVRMSGVPRNIPQSVNHTDLDYLAREYGVSLYNDTLRQANFFVDPATGSDRCSTSFYSIRPLIAIIPATIRFLQCLRRYHDSGHKHPHLTNAGKYSTTFFVVLCGTIRQYSGGGYLDNPFFYLWMISYAISTAYTYTWDIRMDWGLFAKGSQNKFLRDDLVYNRTWVYYAAIVADLVLRLGWTFNVSAGGLNDYTDLIVCVTALLECFRRCMWNFFRLENEHLNNCGDFRAIRDISIKTVPWSEPSQRSGTDGNGTKLKGPKFKKIAKKVLANRTRATSQVPDKGMEMLAIPSVGVRSRSVVVQSPGLTPVRQEDAESLNIDLDYTQPTV